MLITNKIIAMVSGCLLLIGGLAGCGSSYTFTPQFEAGQTYSQKVTLVSNLMMSALPLPGVDYEESELVLDYHVREVDPDGTATVEVTIASLKASLKSLGVECNYDSEAGDLADASPKDISASQGDEPAAVEQALPNPGLRKKDNTKHQKRFEAAFIGLKGKAYQVQVDKAGHIIEMKIPENPLRQVADRKDTGMLGPDQVSMLLSESALREYVVPGAAIALGEKKIGLQDSWTGPVMIEVPRAVSTVVDGVYTLDGFEPKNPLTASIAFKIDQTLDSGQASEWPANKGSSRRGGFKIVAVKGEGQQTFSLEKGCFIDQQQILKVEVTTGSSPARRRADSAQDKPKKSLSVYTVKRTIQRL